MYCPTCHSLFYDWWILTHPWSDIVIACHVRYTLLWDLVTSTGAPSRQAACGTHCCRYVIARKKIHKNTWKNTLRVSMRISFRERLSFLVYRFLCIEQHFGLPIQPPVILTHDRRNSRYDFEPSPEASPRSHTEIPRNIGGQDNTEMQK